MGLAFGSNAALVLGTFLDDLRLGIARGALKGCTLCSDLRVVGFAFARDLGLVRLEFACDLRVVCFSLARNLGSMRRELFVDRGLVCLSFAREQRDMGVSFARERRLVLRDLGAQRVVVLLKLFSELLGLGLGCLCNALFCLGGLAFTLAFGLGGE